MAFQGMQTVAQIAFVMLEGARQVLMATCHPSLSPLRIGAQPTQDAFLQPG